ncbi:hypothetical protein [Thiobacillus sp.]
MNDTKTTAKRIFNALAFANVSNLGEFQTLLRRIDEPAVPVREAIQHGTISPVSSNAPAAPAIAHIQGAL